jgi:hypothetical protein
LLADGHFVYSDGTPVKNGQLVLKATPPLIITNATNFMISTVPINITLDDHGQIRGVDGGAVTLGIVIPATDDPDTNPTGTWVYKVRQLWDGVSYNIIAPQNNVRDISDLVDINSLNSAPAGYVFLPKGDPGPTGAQGPQGPTGPVGPPGNALDAATTKSVAYLPYGDEFAFSDGNGNLVNISWDAFGRVGEMMLHSMMERGIPRYFGTDNGSGFNMTDNAGNALPYDINWLGNLGPLFKELLVNLLHIYRGPDKPYCRPKDPDGTGGFYRWYQTDDNGIDIDETDVTNP